MDSVIPTPRAWSIVRCGSVGLESFCLRQRTSTWDDTDPFSPLPSLARVVSRKGPGDVLSARAAPGFGGENLPVRFLEWVPDGADGDLEGACSDSERARQLARLQQRRSQISWRLGPLRARPRMWSWPGAARPWRLSLRYGCWYSGGVAEVPGHQVALPFGVRWYNR